jgi:hypothetical protein
MLSRRLNETAPDLFIAAAVGLIGVSAATVGLPKMARPSLPDRCGLDRILIQ